MLCCYTFPFPLYQCPLYQPHLTISIYPTVPCLSFPIYQCPLNQPHLTIPTLPVSTVHCLPLLYYSYLPVSTVSATPYYLLPYYVSLCLLHLTSHFIQFLLRIFIAISLTSTSYQGGNSWGRGGGAGGGAVAPPTFGQQHIFRGFHTPLTERYHQKWC